MRSPPRISPPREPREPGEAKTSAPVPSAPEAADEAAGPASPVTPSAAKRRRLASVRHPCGCYLHLVRHTGTIVHVPSEEFTIGRNPKMCNLAIDSDVVPNMVSRRHVRLMLANEGTVVAVDCGSLNGTFVNSQRVVGAVTLRHGDVIIIGNPPQCPPELCFTVALPVPTGGAVRAP